MSERAFNKIRDGLLEALTLGGGAPDPRDARIAELEAENARLREALEPFATLDVAPLADHEWLAERMEYLITGVRVDALRRARDVLGTVPATPPLSPSGR